MEQRQLRDGDEFEGAVRRVYHCPPNMPDCEPAETLCTTDPLTVFVPWDPTPAEIAALSCGGTIWVRQWGGLAPHCLFVTGSDGTPVE